MGTMIVVTRGTEREKLARQIPQAFIGHDIDSFRLGLEALNTNPDALLITTPSFASAGFRVPSETLILIGSEIVDPERMQIAGRRRRNMTFKTKEQTDGNA